ncbi:MAG: leucine-rich repeat domain-containing protein [Bacteroidaceae bacterium]|nr:leucine-rich repeat domain-containing protein [Bacteroidaceae bacterium]
MNNLFKHFIYKNVVCFLSSDNKEFISPQGSNAILSKDGKTLILGCRSTILPEGVEVIGDNAFMGRYSKLFLRIPETVHTIGCGAFKYCNTLFELEIPQSVQLIDSEAFSHCLNLKTVLLKTSVDAISSNTFSHSYNLTNVNLTENDEKILNYAFKRCMNLKTVQTLRACRHNFYATYIDSFSYK